MEPTEAINAVEATFRELLRLIWGDQWPSKTGWDIDKLREKLNTERSMRRGAVVAGDLLEYAEFTQLTSAVLNHWEDFAPALGKKKYTGVYIDRINSLRNSPMHSRELLPFERDLLSGIVGELRNLLAIYRSSRGPDMQHYPVIDSIVDSFGNTTENYITELRLTVGTTITFRCRGTDPQARELTWTLTIHRGGFAGFYKVDDSSTSLSQVELSYAITDNDVAESITAAIRMSSAGKYHRHGDHDDSAIFYYSVDPPSREVDEE